MSEPDIQPVENVDNWVFDSLVNFLHGSIWKVPVVGFIEEKSVVFDPDSYNNMTDEKEAEFRKIHEEYKSVVDFMLASFMEDLQVTPEQVEEACHVREHQSKTLPESHITKVALEQLWAAEDFTSFRRLMTRKNIDLQLQSLELLVAKYGVLSPSLRSGDSEDTPGDDGEDDFLQVVIRYSDQLELFKCDYGTEERCPGGSSKTHCKHSSTKGEKTCSNSNNDDSKNMRLHLSGIPFKKNVAPTPANYHATLTSSSKIVEVETHTQSSNCNQEQTSLDSPTDKYSPVKTLVDECSKNSPTLSPLPPQSPPPENTKSPPHSSPTVLFSTTSPLPTDSANVPSDDQTCVSEQSEPEPMINVVEADNSAEIKSDIQEESQLIQLEEAEAAMEQVEKEDTPEVKEEGDEPEPEGYKLPVISPRMDEKTVAEIASTAPQQRRLLTAVRKALEISPDEATQPIGSIEIPFEGASEDLQKRKEYLRAQRDKLIAMKKQEREKLLESASEGQKSARPKSARAAQMALRNPLNMRAATIGEKSLSARRALADRLKQELIEK